MYSEYRFSPEEISIDPGEVEAILGYGKGESPEPVPDLIEQGLSEIREINGLRGGYAIFPHVAVDPGTRTVDVDGIKFNPGKIVTTQLKNSVALAMFICTAGERISIRAREISNQQDPLLGYILDIIGSLLAEKVAEKVELKIEVDAKQSGLTLSDRFSPGYCDWSVSEQQKLFSLFPESFCGVTLSDSSLMHPIKSVSGFIGLGNELKRSGYQCHWCNDKNCIYGNIKRQKKV